MTPEESEEAGRLLAAACADLRAASALAADPEQANEVIGFHAQQAVEKAIKTVLLASSVEIPRTHDVGLLLRILAERTISAPQSVADGDWLTPWAVVARYGAADTSLDRDAAIKVANDAVNWATIAVARGSN